MHALETQSTGSEATMNCLDCSDESDLLKNYLMTKSDAQSLSLSLSESFIFFHLRAMSRILSVDVLLSSSGNT